MRSISAQHSTVTAAKNSAYGINVTGGVSLAHVTVAAAAATTSTIVIDNNGNVTATQSADNLRVEAVGVKVTGAVSGGSVTGTGATQGTTLTVGNNVTISNNRAVTANNFDDTAADTALTTARDAAVNALNTQAAAATTYSSRNKTFTIAGKKYDLKKTSGRDAALAAYIATYNVSREIKDYGSVAAMGVSLGNGAESLATLKIENTANVDNGLARSSKGFTVKAVGINLAGSVRSGLNSDTNKIIKQTGAVTGLTEAIGVSLPASVTVKSGDMVLSGGTVGVREATGGAAAGVADAMKANGLSLTASAGKLIISSALNAGGSALSLSASGDIDASASAITAGSVSAEYTGAAGTTLTSAGYVKLNNTGNKIASFGAITGDQIDIGSSIEFTLTGPLTKKSTADNSVMKVSNYGDNKNINIRYAGNQPTSSVKANKEAGAITATGTGLKFEVKGAGKVMSPTYSYYYPVGSGKKIVNKTSNDGVAYILYNGAKYSAPTAGTGVTAGVPPTPGKLLKDGVVDTSADTSLVKVTLFTPPQQ